MSPLRAFAQSSTVLVTEIYPNPNTGEQEWVELFNSSGDAITLSGWWLTDELTSQSIIYQFADKDLPLKPFEFRQIHTSNNKLNNSGDAVHLYNSQGIQVSRLAYSSSQTGQSQQRIALESELSIASIPTIGQDDPFFSFLNEVVALLPNNSLFCPTPTPPTTYPSVSGPSPTPGATPLPSPTSQPTPTPSPTSHSTTIPTDSIHITEIMACPTTDQTEWIEFFNTGSSLTADDWRITDQNGNYRLINGVLPTEGYSYFSWSGSLLNNTGDSFVVTTRTGQVLGSASYPACSVGKSLALDTNGDWIDASPSPGQKNPILSSSPIPAPSPATVLIVSRVSSSSAALETRSSTDSTLEGIQASTADLPWVDPTDVQLAPTTDQLDIPRPADINTAGSVLGLNTEWSPETERPWQVLFVIMAGLLFVLSGLLPPYDQTVKKNYRVAASLVSPHSVGSADLHV